MRLVTCSELPQKEVTPKEVSLLDHLKVGIGCLPIYVVNCFEFHCVRNAVLTQLGSSDKVTN